MAGVFVSGAEKGGRGWLSNSALMTFQQAEKTEGGVC